MNYVVRNGKDEKVHAQTHRTIPQTTTLNDQRSSSVAQLRLQELMHQAQHPETNSIANAAPVQAVWQWEVFGKAPGKWRWVKPNDVGDKNTVPEHQGAKHGEKYPAAVVVDVAAQHKQEQITQYLSLIPHLKGELDGDKNVKGGHVWRMMQAQWGDRLTMETGEQSDDGPWQCTWRVDARTAKASTMFPATWDEAKLREELGSSSLIGGQLYVSGIKIKKAGNTFYPDV